MAVALLGKLLKMKRNSLILSDDKNAYKTNINETQLMFNFYDAPTNATFYISNEIKKDVFLTGLNKNVKEINFNIQENANVNFSCLYLGDIDDLTMNFYCYSCSNVDIYFADFAKNNNANFKINIYLKEEGAKANWHLASLCKNNDTRKYYVSMYHLAAHTSALVDNYGVTLDDGFLTFSGISEIKKGAYKSITKQNAKIMVFDEKSRGIAKPILKIDEHDIEANHAAVVGKINDDHLFYLKSRGLNEQKAKELITMGYLKPILVGFDDEIKENILAILEEDI